MLSFFLQSRIIEKRKTKHIYPLALLVAKTLVLQALTSNVLTLTFKNLICKLVWIKLTAKQQNIIVDKSLHFILDIFNYTFVYLHTFSSHFIYRCKEQQQVFWLLLKIRLLNTIMCI